MKSILISLILTFVGFFSQAQDKVSFDEITHDFGVIEEGYQAKYEFTFVNTSDEPIELVSVRASCGCTTPFYTKESVMPGETGTIKVNYNSSGRLGAFNKSITAKTSSGTSSVVYIKGIVEPKTKVEEPTTKDLKKSPLITVNKEMIYMGEVEKGKEFTGSIKVINNGKSDLVVDQIRSACGCIKFQDVKRIIKPKEETIYEFVYRPPFIGKIEEVFTIYSNDLSQRLKPIKIVSDSKESLLQENILKTTNPSGF